jgi:ribonuclease P protein component
MLRGTKQFDAVQRSGQVRAHPLLIARFVANEDGTIRWGLSTGKRLGGAVVRNRVRRRLREGIRGVQPHIRKGWDIMLIARPESATADSKELHGAIVDLARRAGLLRTETE